MADDILACTIGAWPATPTTPSRPRRPRCTTAFRTTATTTAMSTCATQSPRGASSKWRVVEERIAETDGTPEHAGYVERSHKLLAKIADTEAHTFRGALAKARICFDDDEIEREMQAGVPIERVGASGLRNLFKLTGEA